MAQLSSSSDRTELDISKDQSDALKLAAAQPASSSSGNRVAQALRTLPATAEAADTGMGQSAVFSDTSVLEVVADAIRQGVAGAEAARALQRSGLQSESAAAGLATDTASTIKSEGRGGGLLDTTVARLPVLRDLRWRLDWLASSSARGSVGEPAAVLTFIIEDPPAARADERSAAEDEASHGGPGPAAARFRTVEVGCNAHRLQSLLEAVEAACKTAEKIGAGSAL